ncbi:2-amino-4-hydroxy-6-hydroxymethyldihydropteridine diphosphokinase [Aestuariirhabdus litorea]|uniref:2-amino-4-hydroxy-6-hydroxymethyldihydropteridine pyrophosphokinase n=1 Tax=Aestuariirhabdus litorea TaxID=2528527 RepID=A0A3P3VHQ4_9GAMM|nr:2-amino-4-hydroxy-6-hydroxymethyldihydropteridine diphosphokinase [Aestuariirhabdus litorea]RRJ82251.1 2-amino-4-hydroxy-6-hydroxymethyldihydropteridine diphosphokinase [Aestuariirhabdus litorea]RWW92419.1 2-amino-4-hydroxy-6-hydroxymethyldihydropteridine diphosphokinase [Endozoicomonadaceae bacterium GTF-13]
MIRCYLGLGSNLAAPQQQLQAAVNALSRLPQSRWCGSSSQYGSRAVGPEQPDYLNLVAALDTRLSPLVLLDALQTIEQEQGRERKERWGPRTLDIDLLLYGNQSIDLPRLKVPHPEMHWRDFVLVPLQELAPDSQLPTGESLAPLLATCVDTHLTRVGPPLTPTD